MVNVLRKSEMKARGEVNIITLLSVYYIYKIAMDVFPSPFLSFPCFSNFSPL